MELNKATLDELTAGCKAPGDVEQSLDLTYLEYLEIGSVLLA